MSRELLVLSLSALAMLNGCATSAISVADAVPIPATQIYRAESLPSNGNGHVTIVRDVGALGSAVFVHLYIDGDRAASLDPGQKVEFILPPGEHTLGVKGTDPFGVKAIHGVDVYVQPDRRYLYRIHLEPNTGATIRRLLKEETP